MNLAKTSIVTTVLAIPVGIAVAFQQHGLDLIGVIVLTPIAITLLAGALAVASLVKREQPRWLSVLALVIAVTPTIILAGAVAYERAATVGVEAGRTRENQVARASGPAVRPQELPRPGFA